MDKKARWKVFPGKIETVEYPSEISDDAAQSGIAADDREVAQQSVHFWEYVLYVDSPEGRDNEARELKAAGWEWSAKGWTRDGVLLMSEAGFHADRDSYSLLKYNAELKGLARLADGLPGAALLAIWAAFLSGASYAEKTAYKGKSEIVGAPKKVSAEDVERAYQLFKATPGNSETRPTFEMLGKPRYWRHPHALTRQNLTMWREAVEAGKFPR